MAGAEIIGAAIGVLLLILVGYLLIGSALTSAEVVTSAQNDITLQNEQRLHTSIDISSPVTWGPPTILTVTNTGNEPIGNFSHMDVILFYSGNPPEYYSYSSGWSHGAITPNFVHPDMLDPGEQMVINVNNLGVTVPVYVQVICPNGMYSYNG